MNGTCSRCGATLEDGRAVLRAGAAAYASARTAALEMRWSAARKDLALAASMGLSDSPEWQMLHTLVTNADPVVPVRQSATYATARMHALRGDYRAVESLALPDVPTANHLHRLCQQGTRLRNRQRRQTWINTGAIGSTCALLAVGTTWALRPSRTSSGAVLGVTEPNPKLVSPSPAPPAPPTAPSPVAVMTKSSSAIVAYPFPERLTRRYYNDALALQRTHNYKEAARLADMAIEHGKTSYLLPHALLLRAKLANILQEPNAPQIWARIAQDAPDSPYAPLGLLRAATSAKKDLQDPRAAHAYLLELMDKYPLSNEARRVRNSLIFPVNRDTKDNAQRQ